MTTPTEAPSTELNVRGLLNDFGHLVLTGDRVSYGTSLRIEKYLRKNAGWNKSVAFRVTKTETGYDVQAEDGQAC